MRDEYDFSEGTRGKYALRAGARVMYEGGYGTNTFQLPGTLIEEHPGHLNGAPCRDHHPSCVHWSVKLDTGSETVGYPEQFFTDLTTFNIC